MTDRVDRLWERARSYAQAGNAAATRISLESLLQRQPRHAAANLMLSCVAWEEGRMREAAACALAATAEPPPDPGLQLDIARALVDAGEAQAALHLLAGRTLTGSGEWRIAFNVAGLMRKIGDYEGATRLMERAAAAGAQGPEFEYFRGELYTALGQLDHAEAAFDACIRFAPGNGQAMLNRSLLRRQTAAANHLGEIGRARNQVAAGSHVHAVLGIAEYKELQDLGRYDEAWSALTEANASLARHWKYDPAVLRTWTDRVIEACTADFLRAGGRPPATGPQPIFIFGMPRSGTTLLDRLLGAHPRVRSVGELDDFPAQLRWLANSRDTLGTRVRQALPALDYAELGARYLDHTQWRAPDHAFYIDKRPWNQFVAGLIRRALSGARMLRMVRDGTAVCFSNFRTYLGESFAYSYTIDSLVEYTRQCARINAYWNAAMPGQVMDVSYAALVTEPEATMRKVLDFCGLEWDPACLSTAANKAAVATPSAVRVRGDIDRAGLGEWRHYATHLEGLRRGLGTLA